MATDKNCFDDFLKAKLHRDVLFRMLIWGLISATTAFFASQNQDFSWPQFFIEQAKNLAPVVNIIGSTALAISLLALILKDLEYVAPQKWGYHSRLGCLGGFPRRLAGDLTLWVIGALVTLLSGLLGMALASALDGALSSKDIVALAAAYLFMVGMLIVVSIVNILVRRASAPLAATKPFSGFMTSEVKVAITYLAGLLLALAFLWLTQQV